MDDKKEVQQKKSTKKKDRFNLNLAQIYTLIKKNIPPSHLNEEGKEEGSICSIMNFSKSRLSRYLNILDNSGFTKKVGLIRVILKDFSEKQVQQSTRVANNDPLTLSKYPKNTNRGHGFRFKIILRKNLTNWNNEKRTEVLEKIGINFYQLKHLVGGGQGLIFKGRKVHLTNNSIIIFENASYLSRFARASKSYAIADMETLIKKLESLLKANLFNNSQIKFKVLMQHHATIKNSLAKQYNRNNKKLEVYTGRGLTFLIDNSFKLAEFEGVHKDTSDSDMDDKVIPFFKSLDKDPTTTTEIKNKFIGIDENFNKMLDQIKHSSELSLELSKKQVDTNLVIKQVSSNLAEMNRSMEFIVKKLKDIGA